MNEHEPVQPDPEEPRSPRPKHARRPEVSQEGRPPGDPLDEVLLAGALDAMKRYAQIARDRGEAFLAYQELRLDVEPDAAPEDFVNRYLGHWPDRSSFVRSRLDALGWTHALKHFVAEQGMWHGDVAWDDGVLWDHFADRYGLIERFGGVHAFRI